MFLGRGDSLVRHVIQTRHEGSELMRRAAAFSTTVGLVLGLMTSIGHAQLDGLFEFDAGGEGRSWDDAMTGHGGTTVLVCVVPLTERVPPPAAD